MNEFTKEELKITRIALLIYNCAYESAGAAIDTPCELMSAIDKIKNMIDNFCEHDWEESIHDGDLYICINCGLRKHWTENDN